MKSIFFRSTFILILFILSTEASGTDQIPSLQDEFYMPEMRKNSFLGYPEINGLPGEQTYPLRFYMNIALDCVQVPRAFSDQEYLRNHGRVFSRIGNPMRSIQRDGGFGKFFRDEFASERLMPNITLHFMGNGYEYRQLGNWFSRNGYPYPYFLAFLLSYSAFIGNEAVESSNPKINSHDHIADLYIFNFLGIMAFSNDTVVNYFHHRIQLRQWGGEPIYHEQENKFVNMGTSYVMRPFLFGKTVRPFIYMGMHYFGGISVKIHHRTYLSLGGGLAVVDPLTELEEMGDYFKTIRPSMGIFVDQDDRLFFSCIFNSTNDYVVKLNLYPVIADIKNLQIFLGVLNDGSMQVEVAFYRYI